MRTHLFILIFAICGFWQVNATHVYGMDFHYRYIGDSTGIAHEYEFSAIFYRHPAGIPAPQNLLINATSSCFSGFTFRIHRDLTKPQGLPDPTVNTCVDTGSGAGTIYLVYYYKGTTTLPGLCSNYVFSYSIIGRSPKINIGGALPFVIRIQLNNTLGPNSSPKFRSNFLGPLPVNRSVNFLHGASEPDGDSLRYALFQPTWGLNNFPLGFNFGYTYQQPLPTSPPGQLVLDPATGIFNFTLSQMSIGDFLFALEVSEYRFDSAMGNWLLVGTSVRDITVSSTSLRHAWVKPEQAIDLAASNALMGSSGKPVINFSCGDTAVTFSYKNPHVCNTLAADGTDFRLVHPNGQLFPIISAIGNCENSQLFRRVSLSLVDGFTENGDYYLYSKVGSDGNTLQTVCGFALDEFDTIIIRVTDCPPSSGIGLEQLQSAGIQIGDPMPNPGRDYVAIPINITQPAEWQIKVIGINGQVVWQHQMLLSAGPQKIELHSANWPSGLYVVLLQTPSGVVTRRMELAR